MSASISEIFLIEDRQSEAILIKEALRRRDSRYNISHAATLKDATAKLKDISYQPDIILLDLTLPGTGGIETYRAVRLCRTETPILILTGYFSLELAQQLVDEGAGGYILKSAAASPEQLALSMTTAIAQTNVKVLERRLADMVQKVAQSQEATIKRLPTIIVACSSCHKVHDIVAKEWLSLVAYLERYGVALSHTLCPDCMPGFVDKAVG